MDLSILYILLHRDKSDYQIKLMINFQFFIYCYVEVYPRGMRSMIMILSILYVLLLSLPMTKEQLIALIFQFFMYCYRIILQSLKEEFLPTFNSLCIVTGCNTWRDIYGIRKLSILYVLLQDTRYKLSLLGAIYLSILYVLLPWSKVCCRFHF